MQINEYTCVQSAASTPVQQYAALFLISNIHSLNKMISLNFHPELSHVGERETVREKEREKLLSVETT